MHIAFDPAQAAGVWPRTEPGQAQDLPERATGDVVDISREAWDLLRERAKAGSEPSFEAARTFSLREIESRIAEVEAQIQAIWNSSLPRAEKIKQVGSLKTEISLLQAGQFTFAKHMMSRVA